MEDIIVQLRILAECDNALHIFKTHAEMPSLRAAKYGIVRPEVEDELEGIDPKNLGKESYKLDKLATDRVFLNEVIESTYLDLAMDGIFKPLSDAIDEINERRERLNYLAEEDVRHKAKKREVMRNLRQQRNRIRSAIYENDIIIDRLRNKIEDASLNKEVQIRYVDHWQQARTEQHVLNIYNKESGPSDGITSYRRKAEEEQRVHAEVELITNILINETLTKVENFMQQYDKDIEAVDLKIQIKRHEYEAQLEERLAMEVKFAAHDVELQAWKKFKVEREEARLYRLKMIEAAIAVQAWWRGLLVRLQIGPFKQKRKPAAKGAKKKKK
ncbi:dynein regulatory complex protein 9-like isoform X2 [Anticarsia gemmatalis]